VAHGLHDGRLRPGNDWSRPTSGPIPYSTLLSAIMAVEQRSRIEAGYPARERVAATEG
jgi:hypothetical protein